MPRDLAPTEEPADSPAFRAALRREKLAARMAIGHIEHAELSARLEAHLEAFLCRIAAMKLEHTLAFCAPTKNEFDAGPLVIRLMQRNAQCIWHTAMPVVVALDAPMIFRSWTSDAPMSCDRYGIPIPAAGIELAPSIVLLPLVAFDDAGYRLGYGGGYFDRTLAIQVPRPLTIGVGFELARVPSIRPQAHDVPLDVIITEAGAVCYNDLRGSAAAY